MFPPLGRVDQDVRCRLGGEAPEQRTPGRSPAPARQSATARRGPRNVVWHVLGSRVTRGVQDQASVSPCSVTANDLPAPSQRPPVDRIGGLATSTRRSGGKS